MKLGTKRSAIACVLLAAGAMGRVNADVRVTDDAGHVVRLERHATRIVSLAPHVTEQLFAAGAGARVVGAVDYSDYPPEAQRLPRVGSNRAVDMERVLSLKPDLIVVWFHGMAQTQLELLRSLGVPLYYNEPQKLDDVATSLERLGALAGTEAVARTAARDYRERLRQLSVRNGGKDTVSVFYEIWDRPMYTINGAHLISDVLRMCGGKNVFTDLRTPAPVVTQEAVLKADPEVIIGSGTKGGTRPEWLDDWKKWPYLRAVKMDNLFGIDPDLLNRHGPRIAEGARRVCELLDVARSRRKR